MIENNFLTNGKMYLNDFRGSERVDLS